MYRIEKDYLGEKEIPSEALWGIHALRARENFPGNSPFPPEWYKAVGITKQASYITCRKFRDAALKKSGKTEHLNLIGDNILDHLIRAAGEVSEGLHLENFIVPGCTGRSRHQHKHEYQ